MSTVYQIKGMGCTSCVGKIEEELKKHPAIEATVTLDTHSIEIKTPNISKDEVQQILTSAGKYEIL
ncbi:MAG: heavy-metal-associated domain-containing protein [Flavobacteriaceae bacterium]|jgi:copper chaperone CopZ|nr:heavy-metal-associated domain-containing protein [Flavobacteriaceae bacterium]